MKIQNLTLIFEQMEKIHLVKDVCLVPVSMKESCCISSTIVCFDNKNELPDEYRGVPIHKLKRWNFFPFNLPLLNKLQKLPLFIYLIIHSKKIDTLMLFHLIKRNYWYVQIYLLFNPKGKVYLKLDMDEPSRLEMLQEAGFSLHQLRIILKKAAFISIETQTMYHSLFPQFLSIPLSHKLFYLPNGIDATGFKSVVPHVFPFTDRKNNIITVARIGTPQKNNKMLLDALSGMDLQDWFVYFIGIIDQGFQPIIDSFYQNNPTLKDRVYFTGMITDQQDLYQYFNQAKVFVLTSVRESYGLVLVEALYFGDYILTTAVGSASEVTQNGKLGTIIPINATFALREKLKEIISGKVDLRYVPERNHKFALDHFQWDNLIRNFINQISNLNE